MGYLAGRGSFSWGSDNRGLTRVTSFQECVDAGNPVMESYPRQCRSEDGVMFIEDIGNVVEKQDLIWVTNIQPNQVISSPLEIRGEARGGWFFEASFPVELLDYEGRRLSMGIAQAEGEWMTKEFVAFKVSMQFDVGALTGGTLVLHKDNPSDMREFDDALYIPVLFGNDNVVHPTATSTLEVKVYFNRNNEAPGMECVTVYPLVRTIPKTEAVARAVLQELLWGPTEGERDQGYRTLIDAGVGINSLVIDEGVAKVDFDSRMQGGGSCRVAGIVKQITETLKQFSSVRQVVISVDGNIDEALQP